MEGRSVGIVYGSIGTRRQSDARPTWTQGRTTEEEGTAGARFQQSLFTKSLLWTNSIFTYAVAGLKELDTIVQQQAQLISSLDTIVKQQAQLISSLEGRLLSLESK